MHCQRSPICFDFIRDAVRGIGTTTTSQSMDVLEDPVFTSLKSASLLRRDVINEQNVGDVTAVEFSSSKVDTTNDDHIDAPDMANNYDSDNYEWEGIAIPCPPTPPPLSTQPVMFTTDQKWTVALLKLLDDMNAPDYAFNKILKWAHSAQAEGYAFHPANGGLSRTRNIDMLFASLKNAKQLLPSVSTVEFQDGTNSDVITFDFVPQLLNLLQNPALMTAEKLSIDPLNPLMPYFDREGRLGDALSGSVYRDAYADLITNPNNQLFVPIIQWIDRTTVTGNDRYSLKPYMFTPAIFKEKFRRTIQAWGYHGFLPRSKASSAQNKGKNQGDNVRNYHQQLYKVLESFTTAGPRLCNVTLPIGPKGFICVDIVTCILFVIQDMQEGDMLCGRFGPHTPQIQRHCRACTVNYKELDNPDAVCEFVLATDMAQIANDADDNVRRLWSQHFLNNAFDFVPLADPIRGIFGATPVETMHALRKGIIEMVTFSVLDNVPASKKAQLDTLAVRFHKTHRQTCRKTFPATDFSNGITNLTKITAGERLGLVFLFVILAQYDEGWEILSDALLKQGFSTLSHVLHVFEGMLCFDAWTNKEFCWTIENHVEAKTSALASIKELLRDCQDHIPLGKKKSWKFPKFHELLHLVEDMERFGSPLNYCAQRPESLLIPVAKQPGRRAQKRQDGSTYELQSAQRLAYSIMIDTFYTRIWDPPDAFEDECKANKTMHDQHTLIRESTGKGTFGTVTYDDTHRLRVCWNTTTNLSLMHIPNALLHFLCQTFGHPVRFCTEYVRNEHTYRCHPCYQSGGPMYDWMNVKFVNKRNNTKKVYPSRLAAVVINDKRCQSWQDPYLLVVQCATKQTGINSVLLTEWLWSDTFNVISPSNIVAPCFVISIKDDHSKILETLPMEEWANEFTQSYD